MNQEHKNRWITAVLGLIALFGIYFVGGHWGLVFISIVISTAAYYEFLTISRAAEDRKWLSVALGCALSIWLCLDLPAPTVALYLAMAAIMGRSLLQVHYAGAETLAGNFFQAQTKAFGLLYMVFFTSFVPRIHSLAHGPELLLFLLLVIWLGDTAAYYGGKTMGKRKLSPSISPGKTLEGSFTALLTCALLGIAFGYFALTHVAPWKLAVIAVLSSVVAQAGDLLESLMKRAYHVKDSGTLVPGHGGVFDRFDSLILAAPFFYLLVRIGT